MYHCLSDSGLLLAANITELKSLAKQMNTKPSSITLRNMLIWCNATMEWE